MFYKIALPTTKKLVSLPIVLRHLHRIPTVNKPKVTPWQEKHIIHHLHNKKENAHCSQNLVWAYKYWKMSQWAHQVQRISERLAQEPSLRAIRREILLENRRNWLGSQTRSYFEKEFSHADTLHIHEYQGKQYLTYSHMGTDRSKRRIKLAECSLLLSQYWEFMLNGGYESWQRSVATITDEIRSTFSLLYPFEHED